jgi:hypothetical protein
MYPEGPAVGNPDRSLLFFCHETNPEMFPKYKAAAAAAAGFGYSPPHLNTPKINPRQITDFAIKG